MPTGNTILPFVLEKSPWGVLVYDAALRVKYQNAPAAKFLDRCTLPSEVPTIARNIFKAIARHTVEETFPGQVCFTREAGRPPRKCTFRITHREQPSPLVCVYMFVESASDRVDMTAAREDFRLTRRETDLVRMVLDGMQNREISEDLGIAEQTVKDHLSNVYRKTGVKNRFALARLLSSSCHR